MIGHIRKGVPIPNAHANSGMRAYKYRFAEMEVDDYYFAPERQDLVCPALCKFAKRTGRTFTTRVMSDGRTHGTGVWRLT
jgi:hypothetical protein